MCGGFVNRLRREDIMNRSTLRKFCPRCNEERNVRKNGHSDNHQLYQCKKCKYIFQEGKPYFGPSTLYMFCPKCNEERNVRKRCGFLNGRQGYQCKECNYRFRENNPYSERHQTKYNPQVITNLKEFLINDFDVSPAYLSKKYNVCYSYVVDIRYKLKQKSLI